MGRLDDEGKSTSSYLKFCRHVFLRVSELDVIRECLRSKIDTVRIDDKIDTLVLNEEIEQADAGYIGRVGEWLKRRDRGAGGPCVTR